MHGRDLAQGNLFSRIWALARPVRLSIFFQTLYNAVDGFWVGRRSAEAIAAVSISQITLFVMISLSMGITVGSGVLIAMSIGRRDIVEMVTFRLSRLGLRWSSVKQVLNIGLPAALTNVLGPLSLAALTAVISARFREAGAISFSLGFRVEFFAYLPAIGFGVAALAPLGQNTGTRRFDRIRAAYRSSLLLLGFGGATVVGLLAVVFRDPFISIFTTALGFVGRTAEEFQSIEAPVQ